MIKREIIIREVRVQYPRISPVNHAAFRLWRLLDEDDHVIGHRIEGWMQKPDGSREDIHTTCILTPKMAKVNTRFSRIANARTPVHPNELSQLNHDLTCIPDSTLLKKIVEGREASPLAVRSSQGRQRKATPRRPRLL
jgi:hypothetical protein